MFFQRLSIDTSLVTQTLSTVSNLPNQESGDGHTLIPPSHISFSPGTGGWNKTGRLTSTSQSPSFDTQISSSILSPTQTSTTMSEFPPNKGPLTTSINLMKVNTQQHGGVTAANSGSSLSPLPRLTLKLRTTPSPKTIIDDTIAMNSSRLERKYSNSPTTHRHHHHKEPSPELVRISPLVTRPPKQKNNQNGK